MIKDIILAVVFCLGFIFSAAGGIDLIFKKYGEYAELDIQPSFMFMFYVLLWIIGTCASGVLGIFALVTAISKYH